MPSAEMMFHLPDGVDVRGAYELSLESRRQQLIADMRLEREWRASAEINSQLKDPIARANRRLMRNQGVNNV